MTTRDFKILAFASSFIRKCVCVTGRILMFSSNHLHLLVPAAICFGAITGQLYDFTKFKMIILPMVMLLIYPSMIGIDLIDLFRSFQIKLVLTSIFLNFVIVPIAAYALGAAFLQELPSLFAGLALASLLPTSSMTITYTLLAGGNMQGALKITIISLLLGSSLSPFYLFLMVGQYMPFDISSAVRTLSFVIFIPMIAGVISYNSLKRFMTVNTFNVLIRPYLPGISALLAAAIICISVGMESRAVISSPNLLLRCLSVLLIFYLINYLLSVIFAKAMNLGNKDGLSLLYSTVLRNLAISTGTAAAMFGSQAAFMVSMAFFIQPIAASWFIRINKRWRLL